MKSNIFLLISLLGYAAVFSQVGINTTNPQGIFNVDGGKDNTESGTRRQQHSN